MFNYQLINIINRIQLNSIYYYTCNMTVNINIFFLIFNKYIL